MFVVSIALSSDQTVNANTFTILPREFHWDNFTRAFGTDLPMQRFLLNSVIITALSVLGGVMTAMMAGYALARLRFPGRKVWFYLFVGSGTVGANEVNAGDCLKKLPASGLVLTVDTAPCDEPHKGEIFAVMNMPDGDFPGQSAIEEYQNKCAPELLKYSPEAASDPKVGLFVLYPSEDSWGEGDRTVTCIATSDTPRTGTLKD